MVDVTSIQPLNKVKVIHFGTNRFRFLIMTAYRLLIVTFALGRTV